MPDERSSPSSRRDQTGSASYQSRYLKTARPLNQQPEPPADPDPPQRSGMSRREAIVAGTVVAGGIVAGATWLATRGGDEVPQVPASPTSGPVASPTAPEVALEPTATPTLVPTSPAQVPAREVLVETSVADIAGFIGRREVSARALVEAAEQRISLNDSLYGAVIELNPDAGEIARQLDDELARGVYRGPFHGVPVMLKDIFATGDNMHTTSGALALADNTVVEDAAVVKRLRDAGAVILGKTNMTEWSNVRSGGQTAGWSDRGGQTRNPYDPDDVAVGLQLRLGGGGGAQLRAGGARLGDERLDHLPGGGVRRGRHEADGRSGQPHRRDAGGADARLPRPDRADGRGCRRDDERAGRPRPGGSVLRGVRLDLAGDDGGRLAGAGIR